MTNIVQTMAEQTSRLVATMAALRLLFTHLLLEVNLVKKLCCFQKNKSNSFLLLSPCVSLVQQDGSKKYVVYTQGQTWQSSQDLCRQNHTDLACVLTDKENAAIAAVTTKAWIGLFKDAWVWSDGTKTSFRYWKRGGSYSGNCVSVEGSQTGRWIPADCNKKRDTPIQLMTKFDPM
uniref:C-type lectin domain-containing protein n=1 Tax=Astatotilapia calliptera TaxID=8154 RepID=A0AAX7T307_ASTCA